MYYKKIKNDEDENPFRMDYSDDEDEENFNYELHDY